MYANLGSIDLPMKMRETSRDNDKKRCDNNKLTTLVKKCPFVVQPNDYIHISSKWHGCVDKDTIINTNLGDLTIGEIVNNKLNVNVKAFDIENNNIVYVPIDNWYTIPNDGDWYELTLEDGRTIQITGNNPVWLPELNCYRRVEDLNINDILLVD